MSRTARMALVSAVALFTALAGGCSRPGTAPEIAAVVEGSEIRTSDTETLLRSHVEQQLAQEGADRRDHDDEREQTLRRFVLLFQIKHALLRHLAREMNLPEPGTGPEVRVEAEAGRVSRVIAEQLFPDVPVPEAVGGDVTADLVDQRRQSLFSEWFDKQLRTAEVWVDEHYGRWDSERGVVR